MTISANRSRILFGGIMWRFSAAIVVLCTGWVFGASEPARGDTSADIKAIFANPPRQYSSGPLWVWNDWQTEEQIVQALRDFAAQKVMCVFVHPRPGLMTPYLSERWMQLWKLTLAEAAKLDMDVWIYDENSYPSGFAGGWVPETMPESRGKALVMTEKKEPPTWTEDTIAVYTLAGEQYEDISAKVRAGQTPASERYLVVTRVWADANRWTAGRWYVDLMRPGVTEKFLEVTLEAYRKEFGEEFGKRVPGSFTDEPNIRVLGVPSFPWTDDLFEQFEKRWGYRLTDHLPCLDRQVGDYRRIRHNYRQILNDLFIERWARPYYAYCEKHGLEFTGHYWEHDWPICSLTADSMALSAWQHRPGIDILCNQYDDQSPQAQFGNARSVRELGSVANQLGRRRTLCEAYGAAGWDLRFEDMKRIGDWMYALGVNTLNQHLAFSTIRGARKRDYPQSFSYHEPWWEAYHVSASYFTRLSAALAHGQEINHILIIEPTSTAWMYTSFRQPDPPGMELGKAFQKLVTTLAQAQVEYDIGCEDMIARFGGPSEMGKLVVGQRGYSTVVIPPLTENLNAATAEQLMEYLNGGGEVWCCGEPPSRVDGVVSDLVKELSSKPGWKRAEVDRLSEMLLGKADKSFAIKRAADDRGILYHQRRQLADGQILFMVNTSLEANSKGTVQASAGGVEEWDLVSGSIKPMRFEKQDKDIRFTFDLPPAGSLLVFVSKETLTSAPKPADSTVKTIKPKDPIHIRRLDPNVLTIDFADVTAGGETKKNAYIIDAGNFVFQRHGFDHNPWDSAVQFKDELISRKFSADSGFEATYHFTIEGRVPAVLSAVIERADLYTVTCNGQPLTVDKRQWWLDKAFHRLNIRDAARVGENTITLKAAPMTMWHELEPAYIIGDFDLKPVDKGFVIVPEHKLNLGPWNEQGLSLYGHRVLYQTTFDVSDPKGQYVVKLGRWCGTVAKVIVNGRAAGYIAHQPWECDVSKLIQPGSNQIEVIVFGSLKNPLGPHHNNPAPGVAWANMWNQAPKQIPPPGNEYDTLKYGLFEEFVLRQRD